MKCRPSGDPYRRLTIVGGVRERWVVARRGRGEAVCARGSNWALPGGPSTSPLAVMASVAFRISRLPNEASGRRKELPGAIVSGDELVMKSHLAESAPLNDHLVWLWGFLKHERRYLKSLQAEGAVLVVHVSGVGLPVELKPDGAEMLHLLNASLLIDDG